LGMLTSNFIILPLMEVSMKSGEGQRYQMKAARDVGGDGLNLEC
jgi:hypothetical protein